MVLYAISCVVCITGQAYDYQGFLVFPILLIELADCVAAVSPGDSLDEQRRCKLAFQGSPERIKKDAIFAIIMKNEQRLVNTLPYPTKESNRTGVILSHG